MNLIVRARIKPESVADVEAGVNKMFAAIEEARPRGVRYSSSRLADGVTFVAQLELEDANNNPLVSIPAFREFQDNLKGWLAEPPVADQLSVLRAYRSY